MQKKEIWKKCYVIPTEQACNAKCFFCITKQQQYGKRDFLDSEQPQFLRTLDFLYRHGINSFELTGGGEPFLNPQLQSIIEKIKCFIPDAYLKLYTNGSIHKDIKGIDELNISTVHWETGIINAVYQTDRPRDLLTDLEFFYHPDRYKIRLSIPIFKGGIDNKDKAEQLIAVTKRYVDRYVFRPLLEKTPNYDEMFVDFDISGEGIEVDRECNCFSKVCLWWTDNQLYGNWRLDKKIQAF